ncbi:MAG: protein BatD [Calditrichaeota bacterium]|nr:protein BatD [Calditrichota bacterium]
MRKTNRTGNLKQAVILGILWVTLLAGNSFSDTGKISIQSAVDRSQITIGDVITYTVTVTRDKNVKVKLPGLAENLGQFEIRDYKVFDPVRRDGKIIDRVQYKISTFDTGDFQIPPIAVQYTIPPDTVKHVLKSEAIKIHVQSVVPSQEGDIKDIKPPVEIPFDWHPYVKYGLWGLLGLIILGALIYFWVRKRSGKPLIPVKTEPPRPPHELALEALEHLQHSDLLEKGQVKAYYSEVSEIIRRYIGGRFGVDALDLTSSELLRELKAIPISDEHVQLMTEFTELCDLVKFAKYNPEDEENQKVIDWAFQFVRETQIVETAGDEPAPVSEEPVEEGASVSAESATAEEGVVDFKRHSDGGNGATPPEDYKRDDLER